jgi:propionyl-CoA carboxylase alpha chain
MIKKVLIVNRGEIVLRAVRTFKKLGIKTASIYSDADANSIHRFVTDEAINLKGVTSPETYLDFPKILDAIRRSGADAVFPGFGFVSENPKFVDLMFENNIRFIGPNADSMRAMGDKIEAKILAKKAGVNVIPGVIEPIDDINLAMKIANDIGYPVILKAAAGGGGKGIRIVWSDDELIQNFSLTASEALNSFKDGRIFIEKYIENPRHIEIQILGDKHGNIVYFGERECSIQRRHQKIIEEAPSPFFINNETLGRKIREEMGRQSVNLAKSIGYYSAGTVEFVVDSKGQFYFLEVNTRLQVEHPVTEEIIRIKKREDKKIDLIELMVRVENGEKLDFTQNDVYFDGHAIETRIYAENPEMNFIPSSGKITNYNVPEMKNLRVESGITKGSDASIFYDPMLAKICVFGRDRSDAIENIKKALAQLVVSGPTLKTNINFLEQFICLPEFIKGEFSTNFIQQKYKNGFKSLLKQNDQRLFKRFLIAATIFAMNDYKFSQIFDIEEKNFDLAIMTNSDNFYAIHKISFYKNMNHFLINKINASVVNKDFEFIKIENNILSFYETKSNGRKEILYFKYYADDMNLTFENSGYSLKVKIYPGSFAEKLEYLKNNKSQNVNLEKFVLAPLPGLVATLNVKEGDEIEVSANLLVIEAMKMQNIISSQIKGRIKKIFVKEGQSVQAEEKLIEFE